MCSAIIYFTKSNKLYGEFSNTYQQIFMINGKVVQSVENYYQSQKFAWNKNARYVEYMDLILNANSPHVAKILGHQKKISNDSKWYYSNNDKRLINDIIEEYKDLIIRPDWQTVKYDIMLFTLLSKYSQSAKLRSLLLSTGDKCIVYRSLREKYWGDCQTHGHNILGKMLENIRQRLNKIDTDNQQFNTYIMYICAIFFSIILIVNLYMIDRANFQIYLHNYRHNHQNYHHHNYHQNYDNTYIYNDEL